MVNYYELCHMIIDDAKKENATGRAAWIVKKELNKMERTIKLTHKYQEDCTSDNELASCSARCKVRSALEETDSMVEKFHRYWWIYSGYSLSSWEIRSLAYTWIEFKEEMGK